VALVTIILDGKGRVAVMAGTARLTFTHLIHGHLFIPRSGDKDSGMACAATEHAGVDIVTENDRSDIRNFEGNVMGRVTLRAVVVVLYAESPVPIMTGAAGFALIHILHGEWRIFGHIPIENPVVTDGALFLTEGVKMVMVIEHDDAGRVILNFDNVFAPAGIKNRGQGKQQQTENDPAKLHGSLL